jgi:hypothetical protein
MAIEKEVFHESWHSGATKLHQAPDDPRNAEDYDTWDFGMEPIPHDTTWAKKND